jgi:ferredoxin
VTIDYRRFELRRASGERVASVPAGDGETLFDALARSGRSVKTDCRGSQICGQCWVVVEEGLEGLPPASVVEAELLEDNAGGEARARLACLLRHPEGEKKIVVSTDYW